jgi:hypothetical protein
MDVETRDSLLDHSWRHFEFHAKQRLSLFNFCIVWSGLIIAAWSQIMTGDSPMPYVGAFLGSLLVISSLVFWRMDQRNAHLTKMAEEILGTAEAAAFGDKPLLFNTEKADAHLRKGTWTFLVGPQWSHGQSLRVLFVLVAVVGIVGASFALLSQSPVSQAVTQASKGADGKLSSGNPRGLHPPPPTPPPSATPR